ncbi:hypothetical protein ACLOJK_038466 [Asimina triloba]
MKIYTVVIGFKIHYAANFHRKGDGDLGFAIACWSVDNEVGCIGVKEEEMLLACARCLCLPNLEGRWCYWFCWSDATIAEGDGFLSPTPLKKISPHSLLLPAGDGGDGLRPWWIWTHTVVANLLDGFDQPIRASQTMGSITTTSVKIKLG